MARPRAKLAFDLRPTDGEARIRPCRGGASYGSLRKSASSITYLTAQSTTSDLGAKAYPLCPLQLGAVGHRTKPGW